MYIECSPLPILSLFGVDRHDCIYLGFSVMCEFSTELVFFHITTHSVQVHPPQFGPSSRSLPSHFHRCLGLTQEFLLGARMHRERGSFRNN